MGDQRNWASLTRLLARHPVLIQNNSISALLLQERNLKDEDVIRVCGHLLLRPEFTISTAGSFRHVLPQIVRNVVETMRERHAHRMEESFDEEDPLSSGSWNLCVHEYVVVAFSRILELAPRTSSTILQYFVFAPPPFESLFQKDPSKWKLRFQLLDVVRASYRFVKLEPSFLDCLWDWSPFFDLLMYESHDDDGLSDQDIIDIRWCAAQIISLIFGSSDATLHAVSLRMSDLKEEMVFDCFLRSIESCQEIVVEKAGWFLQSIDDTSTVEAKLALQNTQHEEPLVKWKFEKPSRISHVEICDVELPFKKRKMNNENFLPSFSKSFLINARLKECLKALALAISCQEPVLLEGPPGSGKTLIMEELGQLTGNSDAVHIHLDEQVDCKTLLGTYVCTETPGEFQWQPGSLTQAVLQGLWVVFEDIDKASFEVLSALIPLLEDRKLYIPGLAETFEAAEGFQILATISRSDSSFSSRFSGNDVLNKLWRRVAIAAPNDEELAGIIGLLFPSLKSIVAKLIGTLKMIENVSSQVVTPIGIPSGQRILFGRQFSTRDLLKWCRRLKHLKDIESGSQSAFNEIIYREAVDCFSGCIASPRSRYFVAESIGKMWDVNQGQVEYFEAIHKPLLQVSSNTVQIGRVCLPVYQHKINKAFNRVFANTSHAMRNLERIAVCVQQQEPILLVGETGTGKTTLVQHLANLISMPLTVMNLSQHTDSADFIGGFKPIDAHHMCMCLLDKFQSIFCQTFPSQHNADFLGRVHLFAEKKKFKHLLKAFGTAVTKVDGLIGLSRIEGSVLVDEESEPKPKRKRTLKKELIDEWNQFSVELEKCKKQVAAAENAFAFSFVEGAFVKALRFGHWILLDEVNLAPNETLERLTGVLDGEHGSLSLTERGDIEIIPRHPDFRVFACMNPPTDAGKHELPLSLKSRFTEFYVDELTGTDDLHAFVFEYLGHFMPSPPVAPIVEFYQAAQSLAETRLFDSGNQKPRYSLRSLARALEYTQVAMPLYGLARALYDGIQMIFLTLLDPPSRAIMENTIFSKLMNIIGVNPKSKTLLAKVPPQPSGNHMQFEHFWLEKGGFNVPETCLQFVSKYVLTGTRREHLQNLAKAVFIHKYPVLLQGPTSSGKTSLIEYLATVTCHRFVRINNHEHTDLQEYLGAYITGPSGKLVFQEGILVEAVRNGYWIVLDELNLAPSEVLEALNRLLDDNRELFVPELQVTVKPHPHFMLFATQNPPGVYGGRKVLSRAFRNRFLELHVDDIPENELSSILEKRCEIPQSYADKMVSVMKDLHRNRQTSQVFAGKHGFITPRDLFRWADRHRKAGISNEDLAKIGYVLLAERLRDANEKRIVLESLERNLRVQMDIGMLYAEFSYKSFIPKIQQQLETNPMTAAFGKIVWTDSMKRLYSLVEQCYQHNEPLLLVGETGCGKTTVCQLLAMVHGQRLHILNCHQYTETADFLGGYRPVRERDNIALKFRQTVKNLNSSRSKLMHHMEVVSADLSEDIENAEETLSSIEETIVKLKSSSQNKPESSNDQELSLLISAQDELQMFYLEWKSLFVWQDGPLVEAMRNGDLFLLDEISLADDSILERLNSVLEPKRLLVLAEKGGNDLEELVAHPKFLLMATMNPGGDFGKKELSPALRNRFTEIWVPPVTDEGDIRKIISGRFVHSHLEALMDPLLNFWKWFQHQNNGRCLTVRDLLSWINFINTVESNVGMYHALVHGAFLVLLDGIGLGTGMSDGSVKESKNKCLEFLLQQIPLDSQLQSNEFQDIMIGAKPQHSSGSVFGISPFCILKGCAQPKEVNYEMMAPTTSINTFRVLRAMQLLKPVLIEGSPGVGKTSLIAALANISCHSLVRINLSEQTDMMDLLGSDLPVEGQGGAFGWSDGVFLQALKAGSWVVLDELNLASQSVLEGLNACLDHRGEVFIPELGRVFKCHPNFRIFACQNPSSQGGGRKCLPRSFLNRFTKVYIDALTEEDFMYISSSLFPDLDKTMLLKLIKFNSRLFQDTMVSHKFGLLGAPWEFNLRDVLRSCSLIQDSRKLTMNFLEVIYLQRMRCGEDRHSVIKLFEEVFGNPTNIEIFPKMYMDAERIAIGDATLGRSHGPQRWNHNDDLMCLPGQMKCLECMMFCVRHGWMCILVGPAACGKTSLVRLLAKLTGNTLKEFSLSSGTDTTDLLGCFEQYDLQRSWKHIVGKVFRLVQVACDLCLTAASDKIAVERRLSLVKAIMKNWATFDRYVKVRLKSCAGNKLQKTSGTYMLDSSGIDLLFTVLNEIRKITCMLDLHANLDVDTLEAELIELQVKANAKNNTRHFEWVDGGFLKAVQQGDWVLLENANLCNPTVLDRLNPLLEPDGGILINERGLVEGGPMMLRAHPNFRLFLSVDPSYGEVSRAMRNRGVEIYVMDPYTWIEDDYLVGTKSTSEARCESFKQYLIHTGLPSMSLINLMWRAHTEVKYLVDASLLCRTISLRELHQWVELFLKLFEGGLGLLESLGCSWNQIYVHGIQDRRVQSESFQIFEGNFSRLNTLVIADSSSTLLVPGGWPHTLKVNAFVRMSLETVTIHDCLYLDYLIGEEVADKITSVYANIRNRDSLYDHLQNQLDLAPFFPASFLQFFLYPSSGLVHREMTSMDTNLEKKVLFAALWMIEQLENDTARKLCLVWLKKQAFRIGPYCNSLVFFTKVFEKELDHPLFLKIKMSIIENGETREFLMRRMDVFRHMLFQWQLEDVAYKQSEDYRATNEGRLVIESFRFHMVRKLNKSHTDDQKTLIGVLYPLMEILRNLEEEILLLCCSAFSDNTYKIFLNFLDYHKIFWAVIYGGISCFHNKLSWSWKKLKQYGKRLISSVHNPNGNLHQVIKQVVEMFDTVDGVLLEQIGSIKFYLWKNSGHPIVPSSKEDFDQLQELLAFCCRLWPFCYDGSAHSQLISVDETFRRLTLEGVSMVWWSQCGMQIIKQDGVSQHTLSTTTMVKAGDIIKGLLWRQNRDNSERVKSLSIPRYCKCTPLHFLEDVDYYQMLVAGVREVKELSIVKWLESVISQWDRIILGLISDILRRLEDIHGTGVSLDELVEVKRELLGFLDFSMKFSLRSPVEFIPHQQLVWLIDAYSDGEMNNCSMMIYFRNAAHQLCYNWHSSLWKNYSVDDVAYLQDNASKTEKDQISKRNDRLIGPSNLFNASETERLQRIISECVPLSECNAKVVELRLIGNILWNRWGHKDTAKADFLLAHCAFCQVIASYGKTFEECDRVRFFSILRLLCQEKLLAAKGAGQTHELQAILKKSTDGKFKSLVYTHIDLLIVLLYDKWHQNLPYTDVQSILGKVWLLLGTMRLRLMLPDRPYDPASKYSYEHEVLLQRLAETELELEVRQQSDYVIKGGATKGCYSELQLKIQELKMESSHVARKCVYRRQPANTESFYKEVERFVKSLDSAGNIFACITQLENGLTEKSFNVAMYEILQWQDNGLKFICHLKEEYPDYEDLGQPIQLAVYDMKLGLSLLLSASQQKLFLTCQDVDDLHLHEALCAIMEFPSRNVVFCEKARKNVTVSAVYESYLFGKGFATVLENSDFKCSDKMEREVYLMKLKMKIFLCIIAYLKGKIMHAGFVYGDSSKGLRSLFQSVSDFWNDLMGKREARKEKENALIQFKHRSHKMDVESDHDEEAYKAMFPDFMDVFDIRNSEEHNEHEQGESKADTSFTASDQVWKKYEDVMSKEMAELQNKVFYLTNRQKSNVDSFIVSDEQRIHAFSVAYDAGTAIIKGASALLPASINMSIVSSHLMMLAMAEEKHSSSAEQNEKLDVYKDACPSELRCLIKPLRSLKERISTLLTDWPDQPSLLQLMCGVQALLSLPIDVPLMKALVGVEHLLSKAQLWEENAPKSLSLSDVLNGLTCLVSRWRRYELNYWGVVLEKIENECEHEAEKLWFPLYGVLHPVSGFNDDSDLEPTMASLEEFMQTATLGDYKKRLEILMGFSTQIEILESPLTGLIDLSLEAVSSGRSKLSRILSNIVDYYSQFLPQVEEHTVSGRSSISKELQDFIKLHKWDERNYYALVSSADSTHRKVFKLVNKYKMFLHESSLSVISELKQEGQSLIPSFSASQWQEDLNPKSANDNLMNGMSFCESVQSFLQKRMHDLIALSTSDFQSNEPDVRQTYFCRLPSLLPRIGSLLNESIFGKSVSNIRHKGMITLEELGQTVISRISELQEREMKTMVKKKSFVDLLRTLKNLGISHRKSAIPKEERTSKYWLQQPVCRVSEKLKFWVDFIVDADFLKEITGLVTVSLDNSSYVWKRAQNYYFKNITLVQQLRVLSLNFHKDLTLQEVNTSMAYMEHALHIQLKQRLFAEEFVLKLVQLQHVVHQVCDFDTLNSEKTHLDSSEKLRSWLWIQKEFLDSISTTCAETLIFYKNVERLQNCPQRSGGSSLTMTKNAVGKVLSLLSSCKTKLDAFFSGIKLFYCDELKSSWPVVVTPSMEQMIYDNFSAVREGKEILDTLLGGDHADVPGISSLRSQFLQGAILFDDFKRQFKSNVLAGSCDSDGEYEREREKLLSLVLISVQGLLRSKELSSDLDETRNIASQAESIQSWSSFLEKQMLALQLEQLHASVVSTVAVGVRCMLNKDISRMKKDFHIFGELLKFLITGALTVFMDYIRFHKSLSKLSYILSRIFCALYKDGYCKQKDESEHDDTCNNEKEFHGTGMGEGHGKTDVSNEIEDEEQLLGSSQKGIEEDNHHTEKPDSAKGIEMGDDFQGELMDVSQSESDESDDEDDNGVDDSIESKMGETGENENVIDEKLWGDESDEVGNEEQEKYETGKPVESLANDFEYRAKEADDDISEKYDDFQGKQNQENNRQEHSADKNDKDDEGVDEELGNLSLDEDEAYEPPTGVDPSTELTDHTDLEDNDGDVETATADDADDTNENGNSDLSKDQQNGLDENISECSLDLHSGKDTQEEVNSPEEEENVSQYGREQQSRQLPDANDLQGVTADNLKNPNHPQSKQMESSSVHPSADLLQSSMFDEEFSQEYNGTSMMTSNGDQITGGVPSTQCVENHEQTGEREGKNHVGLDSNPLRSLGDALKEWEEKIIAKDVEESDLNKSDVPDEDMLLEGNDYQYVTENQNDTSQALGSATADQVDKNVMKEFDDDMRDVLSSKDDESIINRRPDPQGKESVSEKRVQNITSDKLEQVEMLKGEEICSISDEEIDVDMELDAMRQLSESYVSIKPGDLAHTNTAINTEIYNLDVPMIRRELEANLKEDFRSYEKARAMWSKYEQLTTRLSQELAEQLRLIMEPTLAARLEGDYRTGKRINLKKVIPYIASKFRRDKIWLRRTKPSKRQYQVVLAIDDSRSMSESHCGHMALEALITICRAMSTLEVGQVAVASFGQKGNVKVLHDFDAPFSAEVGIEMISKFSFKQDNTIADEPMVDLLQYLTSMLDIVVKGAMMPSGRHYLQQLVLIIADGRFHEKETLRRCIREAISRGQMLAFIVLDSMQESIMDVQSVSFTGGVPAFSKYIDSFPFPFYILLRNIEELPRTLVDLLRQWFELLQRAPQ